MRSTSPAPQSRRQRALPPAGLLPLRLLRAPVPALRAERPGRRGPGHSGHPRGECALRPCTAESIWILLCRIRWRPLVPAVRGCPLCLCLARQARMCSCAVARRQADARRLSAHHRGWHARVLRLAHMPRSPAGWGPALAQGEMCRMLREAGFSSAEVLEEWKHPLNRRAPPLPPACLAAPRTALASAVLTSRCSAVQPIGKVD